MSMTVAVAVLLAAGMALVAAGVTVGFVVGYCRSHRTTSTTRPPVPEAKRSRPLDAPRPAPCSYPFGPCGECGADYDPVTGGCEHRGPLGVGRL